MTGPRFFRSRLLMLLLIGALAIAGCGGGDDDDDDDTGDATATAPAATATENSASTDSTPNEVEGSDEEEVTLRLGISMTPAEVETFETGLDEIRDRHPNWEIVLEQTPQDGIVEKTNTQIASDELPDVLQVQGLYAQPWIRQGAFADLTDLASEAEFDAEDFWAGALAQFRFEDRLYAVPNIVAPEVVYINKAMFDEAGVEYPTDD